jgi:hypothetical protein
MTMFRRAVLLAGMASLLGAPLALGQLTDPEFKCQQKVSKAGAKFVKSKAKCGSKCISNARKALNPFADCYAPYGGSTLNPCITDPTFRKGAEEKFEDAIRKNCDPTFKVGSTAECPECYSGGDCTQEATDRTASIENQVDSFGPGVYCEQPGADDAETKCELNTAKTLVKLVASVDKCYDKCNSNARKGLILQPTCAPPASDPTTSACISAADGKSIAGINKKCSDIGAIPDCAGTDDYPDGSAWTNLVEIAISGNIPGTYCPSPSGAFLD